MRAFVCFALLAACGGEETPIDPERPAERRAEPAPSEPPAHEPRAEAPVEAPRAEAPPAARPIGDLADCVWYADARPPEETGPRSLEALDAALHAELRRDVWVLGRVRGRARGCPDVSIGLAIAADPVPDAPLSEIYDEAHIVGERGDERRTMPWDEDAPYDHVGGEDCDGGIAVAVVLFRAAHGAGGITSLRTDTLLEGSCPRLHHSLVLGDIDHDGRSEVRVETRSTYALDEASEQHAGHDLWLVDVAAFHRELDIDIEVQDEQFMGGIGGEDTRAELTFRDMDGDGHRDALVRGRSHIVDPMFEDESGNAAEYRDWFTIVHRYDPIADRFVRVP